MRTPAASILIRLCGALLSAGQTVFLARSMGAASLGIYASALALSALLAIPASAGLGQYLTREVAVVKARDDYGRARGLVRAANKVMLFYAGLSLILLLVLYFLDVGITGDIGIVTFVGFIIVASSTDLLRAGAMGGVGSALLSQVPEQVIRPGAFLLLILSQTLLFGQISVHEALFSYCIAVALSALFGQIALRRQLGGYRTTTRISVADTIRASAGPTALGGVQTLFTNIDVLILSFFGLFVAAGQYKVALLGVVGLLFIYAALSAVAIRDLAASLARRDANQVIVTSDRLTVWGMLAMACVAIAYLLVGGPAIAVIFGREFSPAYLALLILSAGHLVGVALGPTVEITRLLQSQRVGVLLSLASLGVMVSVSVVLLNWDPLLGVAIGTASGNVVRRLLLGLHIRKVLGFDPTLAGVIRRKVENRPYRD